MSRLLLLSLLALSAVIASSCGGSDTPSREKFEQSVITTRDRVDFSLARITQAQSKEEFLNRMDEAADTIDDAAGDLSEVGAPADYSKEATQLVDSLDQLAVDLQSTADQIRQPGFEDLVTGAAGLSFDSWDAANRALADLKDKGIAVSLIQRH